MDRQVSIEKIKVSDCISKVVALASPEDTLSDVIGKMKQYDIYELPVVEKNKLLGWVSYTNLIKRRKLALTTSVKSIMVSPPELSSNDSIINAADILFSTGFRTVPVVAKNELVGVVSRADIIKTAAKIKEIYNLPTHTIMSREPICLSEKDGIIKAKDTMRDMGVKNLPVVDDDNRLVGVIGLKDLSRFFEASREKRVPSEFAGEKIPLDIELKSLMTPHAITASQNTHLEDVATLMTKNNISSVIITENNKPTGIVTQADILQLIASFKGREGVYVQISGLEEEPSVYDAMYEMIEKSLRKINKMLPLQMLLVDVTKYKPKEKVAKYALRAKLYTPKGLFISSSRSQLSQWDLMKSLDEVLAHLERQIRIDKGRAKDRARKIGKRESAGDKRALH